MPILYDNIFQEAQPFEEVKHLLFKSIECSPCVWCKTYTYYIDYNINDIPISICSDTCYQQVQIMLQHIREQDE